MLPESDDLPLEGEKVRVSLRIPSPIRADLCPPVGLVCLRGPVTAQAAMKEASVDEDGNSLPRERKIRPARKASVLEMPAENSPSPEATANLKTAIDRPPSSEAVE
jgi:hypothetical protein